MATGEGPTRFAIGVLEDATDAAAFRTAIGAGSGSGTGDVVGPASAVDDRIATFDGTTGKLIQDSGTLISGLALASHTHPQSDVTGLVAALAAKSDVGHAHAGADITSGTVAAARLPTLDAITAPVASVNFADQQALSFRIENRTSDPVSPTTGQLWLRTDL
jgi:Phage tail repeat like